VKARREVRCDRCNVTRTEQEDHVNVIVETFDFAHDVDELWYVANVDVISSRP
jgi:hypothetical protein